MGEIGNILLGVFGVTVVLCAPLEVAFGVLVAFWLLVPGSLSLVHGPHVAFLDSYPLMAFVLRFAIRRYPDGPRGSAFYLTPMHALLFVLVGTDFGASMIAPAQPPSVSQTLHSLFPILMLLVLFAVVLAVVRTIGASRVAEIVTGVTLFASIIGLIEWVTGWGWSAFFFKGIPVNYRTVYAFGLSTRGGHVRSTVAADFPLEYAWVMVALLPIACYGAYRFSQRHPRWRLLIGVIPLVLALDTVTSSARSAEVAVAIAGVGVFAITGLGGISVRPFLVALLGAGLFTLFDFPLVDKAFSAGNLNDPASIRLNRLPFLFSLVHDPLVGIGYARTVVTTGVDNSFALLYQSVGVIGLVAFILVLITALVGAARFVRAPRYSNERILAAACFLGILAVAVACAVWDVVDTTQCIWALVVLSAVATGVIETLPAQVTAPKKWWWRSLLPLGGVAAGFIAIAAVPYTWGESFTYVFSNPLQDAIRDYQFINTPDQGVANTICTVVTSSLTNVPNTGVNCDEVIDYLPYNLYQTVQITGRGPTPNAVTAELQHVFAPFAGKISLIGGISSPMTRGQPAMVVTAPITGGAVGLLAMFLMPALRPRRRRAQTSDTAAVGNPVLLRI